jgi:hypothetical protein
MQVATCASPTSVNEDVTVSASWTEKKACTLPTHGSYSPIHPAVLSFREALTQVTTLNR